MKEKNNIYKGGKSNRKNMDVLDRFVLIGIFVDITKMINSLLKLLTSPPLSIRSSFCNKTRQHVLKLQVLED